MKALQCFQFSFFKLAFSALQQCLNTRIHTQAHIYTVSYRLAHSQGKGRASLRPGRESPLQHFCFVFVSDCTPKGMYFTEHRFSEFWAAVQRQTWGLFLKGCIRVWMAVVETYQTAKKMTCALGLSGREIPWQCLQRPSFRNEQTKRKKTTKCRTCTFKYLHNANVSL